MSILISLIIFWIWMIGIYIIANLLLRRIGNRELNRLTIRVPMEDSRVQNNLKSWKL